jgi:hypothetical protein
MVVVGKNPLMALQLRCCIPDFALAGSTPDDLHKGSTLLVFLSRAEP